MDLLKILDVTAVFMTGFLLASLIGLYMISGIEKPDLPIINNFSFNEVNDAPTDYVEEDQIEVFEDRIIINVPNAGVSRYADTGSMIPLLNEHSNGIRVVPLSEDEIFVGDVIVYNKSGDYIVHRVIEKSIDENGTYFITKGDNTFINDGKIRFEDIKYKTIGVIW